MVKPFLTVTARFTTIKGAIVYSWSGITTVTKAESRYSFKCLFSQGAPCATIPSGFLEPCGCLPGLMCNEWGVCDTHFTRPRASTASAVTPPPTTSPASITRVDSKPTTDALQVTSDEPPCTAMCKDLVEIVNRRTDLELEALYGKHCPL